MKPLVMLARPVLIAALVLSAAGSLTPTAAQLVPPWVLTGRCCGSACERGRCVRECFPLEGTLVLAGLTYRIPGDPCPFGGEAGADEVGPVRSRRGANVLEPTNGEELAAAGRACLARGLDVGSVDLIRRRTRIRRDYEGAALRGVSRSRLAVGVAGRRLGVRLVCRFHGAENGPSSSPGGMGLRSVAPLLSSALERPSSGGSR
jgi:hypothetical protein